MTSTLGLLVPKPFVNVEELTTTLESLPSYEHLAQAPYDLAVFDEEKEPSTGIIEQIRHNSQSEESIVASTSSTVREEKRLD